MAKKRGAKPASATVADQPAARARRPTDETRVALAEAMEAVTPGSDGPTEATKAAIAEVAAPHHRAVSGEIVVPEAPRAPTSPGVPSLAAPVMPDGAPATTSSRAGSDSVIVRSEAMAPAAPAAGRRPGSFSDDDEAFFSSEVSDHTLTVQREREEEAKRPWWRRWLGW